MEWEVCFSPQMNCRALILHILSSAQKSIFIQGYTFTARDIAVSLQQAHKCGVKVIVIVNKCQQTSRTSIIHSLKEHGIPIFIDYKPAIAHNKIMIIDNQTVIMGSYN